MERISSRTNPLVKQFRTAAADGAEALLLDGGHLLEEALASGIRVDIVALRAGLLDRTPGALARRAMEQGARAVVVTDQVLSAISPVRQPSGIVALARRPVPSLDSALGGTPQLVLMLAGIQDPGNVGAIIRAADACGATGVVTGEGTADAFGWKALRGSMGSIFHVPVVAGAPLARAAEAARQRRLRLVAAVPRGGTPLPRCDLRGPTAVLLGGEGGGLTDSLLALADTRISIPMARPVESLNVATAAAIVSYEAMRQRQGTAA